MSSRMNPAGLAFERVPSYRTSDGKLHATRDQARAREAEIAIEAFAAELVEACSGMAEDGATEADAARSVGAYLLANSGRLQTLLREALRRPAEKPQEPAK